MAQNAHEDPVPNAKAAIIPVTLFQQNCTLLWCDATKRAAIIDPGGDLDRIRHVVDEAQVTVDAIWLTHGHIDHAGGAADLKDRLGVKILGPHEADGPILARLEDQGRAYGLTAARNVIPDRWLKEGDRVTVGEVGFDVLHCPGHSPGSVVLVNREERFAIMGDVLFKGSIGRTDLPGGSHEALLRSIRDKVLPLGDDVTFICGHGPPSTIGEERRTNPFLQGLS
jgi:glyoxylase-like metal-dependent hydrolase (beta-lactamase superfamily II)